MSVIECPRRRRHAQKLATSSGLIRGIPVPARPARMDGALDAWAKVYLNIHAGIPQHRPAPATAAAAIIRSVDRDTGTYDGDSPAAGV
jgi:hypothetical protein